MAREAAGRQSPEGGRLELAHEPLFECCGPHTVQRTGRAPSVLICTAPLHSAQSPSCGSLLFVRETVVLMLASNHVSSTVVTGALGVCRRALVAERKCKVKEDQVRLLRHDKLAITAADTAPEKLASLLQAILHSIPDVVVGGIATVGRAVIQTDEVDGRASLLC